MSLYQRNCAASPALPALCQPVQVRHPPALLRFLPSFVTKGPLEGGQGHVDAYKVVVRCHEKQRTRYRAAMHVEGTEGARLLLILT